MQKLTKKIVSKYKQKPSIAEEGKHNEDLNPIVVNTQYPDLNNYIENLYRNDSGSSCFLMQDGSSLALTIHFGDKKQEYIKALADIIRKDIIKTLCLSSNGINDKSISFITNALSINTTLISLELANNPIEASSAIMLATILYNNTALVNLGLSKCKIGDSGVGAISSALEENRTLTLLDISSNKITSGGAKKLATALAKNPTLFVLNVENNDLQDSGAALILNALTLNKTLTQLNISNNNIDPDVYDSISSKIKGNLKLFTDVGKAIVKYLSGPEDAYLEEWVKEYYDQANPVIFLSILEKYQLLNQYDNLGQLLEDKSSLYPEENNVTITYRKNDDEQGRTSYDGLTSSLGEPDLELDTALAGATDSNNPDGGCHCIVS